MDYFIEILYLLFAFVFVLFLCIVLTIQIIDIYQVERNLHTFLRNTDQKIFGESLAYTISQLYTKKCQWIEAIQVLRLTLKRKQLQDSPNSYSLVNLCNTIGCIYDKSGQHLASTYYSQLAYSFKNKRTEYDF